MTDGLEGSSSGYPEVAQFTELEPLLIGSTSALDISPLCPLVVDVIQQVGGWGVRDGVRMGSGVRG